ncbi:MAG: hypothetical protein ACJAYU_004085 [Bradymonadia bacterium]|jgi:hypothetical protein
MQVVWHLSQKRMEFAGWHESPHATRLVECLHQGPTDHHQVRRATVRLFGDNRFVLLAAVAMFTSGARCAAESLPEWGMSNDDSAKLHRRRLLDGKSLDQVRCSSGSECAERT